MNEENPLWQMQNRSGLRCSRCGAKTETLSKVNRICPGCGELALREAAAQMRNKKGPYYERYLTGLKNFINNLKK